MRILEHEPLSARTTFRIGGTARFLIEAATLEEVVAGLSFAEARSLPTVILGGGANMLADDGEAEGVFLVPNISGLRMQADDASVTYAAGAAESWDGLVALSVADGAWGLENLSAIPGSVGGAVVQNIGAYGAALSQHLTLVEVFDREAGRITELPAAACAFGYRDSIFKAHPDRYVVLRATFTLSRAGSPGIAYRDLREHFAGSVPSLGAIREGVRTIRAGKFPDLAREGTAGSFFGNPSVDAGTAAALKERYPELPLYPIPESRETKVPIAWLLDRVLGLRGYRLGRARLFERQALAIVADRDARASDVRALARDVTDRVHDAFGILLVPEVVIMRGARMTSDV